MTQNGNLIENLEAKLVAIASEMSGNATKETSQSIGLAIDALNDALEELETAYKAMLEMYDEADDLKRELESEKDKIKYKSLVVYESREAKLKKQLKEANHRLRKAEIERRGASKIASSARRKMASVGVLVDRLVNAELALMPSSERHRLDIVSNGNPRIILRNILLEDVGLANCAKELRGEDYEA